LGLWEEFQPRPGGGHRESFGSLAASFCSLAGCDLEFKFNQFKLMKNRGLTSESF